MADLPLRSRTCRCSCGCFRKLFRSGVVRFGHPKRVAWIVFQLFFVNTIHVEWRICHYEVELADALVDVFVVRDALPDVASETVNGKVHFAQPDVASETVNGK